MGKRMTLLKRARGLLRDFTISRRGNVAMMFGIALVPIMIAAGAGLDYARGALARSQMSDALDAASLAVGSTTGLTRDTAEKLAQKYFDANYQGDLSNGKPLVTIAANGYNSQGSVTITANYTLPTLLLKVIGQTAVPLTTSSTVVWGQTKLWVSLVLDNSGSMCEPASQACNNTTNTNTKIYQLKSATKDMLTKLQAVSTTAGDVQVAIIPFNRAVDVGTSNVNASWIYWGYWEAEPANAGLNNVTDLRGPGDSCPWSTGSQGYTCTDSALNSASTTSTIPSSGLLCPGIDSGKFNTDRNNNYYNGCYTSVATGATKDVSTGSSATCTGYANCSCSGSNSSKKCTAKYYKHTWTLNARSTWGGCITDRVQNYDVANTSPVGTNTTGFPADNPNSPVDANNCMYGEVMSLGYNWTNLSARVDAMQAKGATNQAIGVAHGWQMLTPGSPYGTPAVPANTTRYIILFSDGLNTRNRWWGDGSTENTVEDGYIDTRMNLTCTAAKTDGVVIYTLYVHTNGGGNSQPLKDCATDASKYYDLTSSTQIAAAFADITKQITNVRVSQ